MLVALSFIITDIPPCGIALIGGDGELAVNGIGAVLEISLAVAQADGVAVGVARGILVIKEPCLIQLVKANLYIVVFVPEVIGCIDNPCVVGRKIPGGADGMFAAEQLAAVKLIFARQNDHTVCAVEFRPAVLPQGEAGLSPRIAVNIGGGGCSLSLFGNKRNEARYHAKAQQQ